MYNSLENGGPKLPELPEKFTADKILEIVQESVEVTATSMRAVVDEAKEKFNLTDEALKEAMKSGDKDSPIIQFILPKFTALSEDVKKSVHKKHDINEQLISSGISKFQNNPDFMMKLQAATKKQRDIFMELGLA